MKVVCIDNSKNSVNVTVGKVYDVICETKEDDDIFYRIKDDNNDITLYFKERFNPYKSIDKLKRLIK